MTNTRNAVTQIHQRLHHGFRRPGVGIGLVGGSLVDTSHLSHRGAGTLRA
ncbi:hypothetical protein KALB_4830 [Kutzneria albida DSM 43870]|uniref:Uncharacterized protein n=1 Tax=Kutzneria albida DSM 43870 TaxID=1449976 RepID=W5WBG3_9PSEU|nr:hypothetical protein KALB_4830 [Kutzneria albida DSM 43870]